MNLIDISRPQRSHGDSTGVSAEWQQRLNRQRSILSGADFAEVGGVPDSPIMDMELSLGGDRPPVTVGLTANQKGAQVLSRVDPQAVITEGIFFRANQIPVVPLSHLLGPDERSIQASIDQASRLEGGFADYYSVMEWLASGASGDDVLPTLLKDNGFVRDLSNVYAYRRRFERVPGVPRDVIVLTSRPEDSRSPVKLAGLYEHRAPRHAEFVERMGGYRITGVEQQDGGVVLPAQTLNGAMEFDISQDPNQCAVYDNFVLARPVTGAEMGIGEAPSKPSLIKLGSALDNLNRASRRGLPDPDLPERQKNLQDARDAASRGSDAGSGGLPFGDVVAMPRFCMALCDMSSGKPISFILRGVKYNIRWENARQMRPNVPVNFSLNNRRFTIDRVDQHGKVDKTLPFRGSDVKDASWRTGGMNALDVIDFFNLQQAS